jgi:two-component system nitrogen regulation response regulator GlnG/two-component system response regulator HydG
VSDHPLPWEAQSATGTRDFFQLVIAWALEAPERLGEAAVVAGPSILGRGAAEPSDGALRLVFHRRRPGESVPVAPLGGTRISRVQLRLKPEGEGLEVQNVGRCPLFVRGVQVDCATVRDGDTLMLRNSFVLLVVRRARTIPALRNSAAPSFPFGVPDPHGIVGESSAIWSLRDALALAARSSHHVLIQGESGSGKELAAGAIHMLSARSGRSLVARNAATVPEGLVDAEFFGTAKNYPHAGSPERPGLVGEADGTTLFLDEIAEMPPPLQAHLLRVLDRGGEYQRLGESRVRRADVRLIAATNRPLEALKQDFAARFAARVKVPGLDQRREDIPLLTRHLLQKVAQATPELRERFFDEHAGGRLEPRLDPLLADALLRHRYTHHLRELDRLLWQALSTSPQSFISLTPEVERELRLESPEEQAAEVGQDEIRAALAATRGSVTEAARKLGLKNRFALYRLMKRFGIAGSSDDESVAGDER